MLTLQKKLWIGIAILALLSPLGIIVPDKFRAGDAWGEWGTDALAKILGYVPEGLRRTADLWKAPVPDYNLGGENAAMGIKVLSYIISGFIGVVIAGLAVYLISRFLVKREQ